ncbi:MAG: hypothetical protein QOE58_3157, partial [Actinomycetota bacterium]|nr:hypothetical protein [Actinomycetota bacterium]
MKCTTIDEVTSSAASVADYSSLVELLRFRALHRADDTAYIFVADDCEPKRTLTYGELDRLARCIAAKIQADYAPGERALLLYPSGLDFIMGFFGCLYAGVVAVPATAPRAKRSAEKLQRMVEDLDARMVLTTVAQKSDIEGRMSDFGWGGVLEVVASDELTEGETKWREISPDRDTLAFIQYTSGSSGDPKGVMVSHGNILHNELTMDSMFGRNPASMMVSWLPLFHDMGLICSVLQPLCIGYPSVMFSQAAFIQRPLMWLQLISEYGATTSGGPNFAYEHCIDKISDDEKADLDLSSWVVAINGAEPVRAETLERFAVAFESCGFRREAFSPCYGMAESTLAISGRDGLTVPRTLGVSGDGLRCEVAADDCVQETVSCGHAWFETKILIVDPESRSSCPDGQVAEIWTAGPSVAQGYWNRPQETEETFGAYLA